jgi:predicted unusual protein kinase regulating ubiquinone biosynthesis (AarF/ABC1/UbiB family)
LNDNSYRTTLNTKSTIDDEQKQNQMLKACHKRCAERTLKVLEKNGGIFIKLGQHLVSAIIFDNIRQHLNGHDVANVTATECHELSLTS